MRVRVLVQALGALAVLLLALVLLGLPSIGQASPPQPTMQQVDPSLPDPRWLELVQETQPLRVNSEQASAPSINLNLTTVSVAGRVATGATVVVSVTRAARLVAYTTTSPLFVDAGYLYVAYPTWLGYSATGGGGYTYHAFEVGDVVLVSQASTTVSMTVPALTALADAITDTVYGSAPVSQTVTAYVFPFAAPDVTYTRSVTANEAGRYQVSFAPLDLLPRDGGYVAYAEAADRQAYVRFVAPLLRAQVGGHELSGYAAPNSSVSIVAADAQGVPYNSPYWTGAGNDGSFRIGSDGWNGPNPLQPGDRITATAAGQTFVTVVLSITVQADLGNDQVRGQAPAGLTVDVLRFSGPIQSGYDYVWSTPPTGQVSTTVTLTGQYTATLPLTRPDYGAVLVTAPDGNQTFARFNIPYMRVHMGKGNSYIPSNYWLQGQVDDFAAPITIAIQGPSGYLKDLRHITAYGNGFFGDQLPYTSLTVDSGDVITLTTPRGIQAALTLPLLTANASVISDTVYGLAPPNSQLTITIYTTYIGPPQPQPSAITLRAPVTPYTIGPMEGLVSTSTPAPTATPGGGSSSYSQYTLVVTATALGEYRADFSQWASIAGDSAGEVHWTTPDGNTVVRLFQVTPACQPRLQTTQIGGNILQFAIDGQQCASVFTVRLRDPQGQIKYESTYTNWSGYISSALYDWFGHPILILPGDTVEIEPGTSSGILRTPTPTPWVNASSAQASGLFTIPIPSLTMTLDPTVNTVSGQAPPGALLDLVVYHSWPGQNEWLTATASPQGIYSASLSTPLQAGDLACANITSFYAIGVLPVLQTTLYEWSIGGLLPPLSPYTVSLTSSRSITAKMNGYADNSGNWYHYLSFKIQPGDRLTVTTPSQVLHLSLPFLSADVDRDTATVHGQAPPNSRLQVFLAVYLSRPPVYRTQIITATASGYYTATFPDLAPLPYGQGTLTHLNEEGHRTRLQFSTAQWQITLGSNCLGGYAGVAGVPYTVTLVSASGAIKGIAASQYTGYLGSFSACFTSTVETGDQLTLTQPGGLMTFTAPELTAKHDYIRRVLEGQSPPDAAISANLPFGGGYITTRHTQADTSGHYGLDTSDLSVQLLERGYVWIMDKAGNTIKRYFIIEGRRVYLPWMLRTPTSGH